MPRADRSALADDEAPPFVAAAPPTTHGAPRLHASPASPSVSAERLHSVPAHEALAFAEDSLGPPSSWPSPLVAYRLGSDFQADWKTEVGQWLKTAQRFGFLARVLHDVDQQARRRSRKHTADVDPNDPSHLKLHQHLAAARVVHYLTATGWGFVEYEPESGGPVDIDCALSEPGGVTVELQVKAPDEPGEHDERVVAAIDHAARQLRAPARGPAMIAVCANRDWSLAYRPGCVVSRVFGSTTQEDTGVFLDATNVGGFFTDAWKQVSGVVLLDLIRGELTLYTCTVLLNPNAAFPADASWFPFARVCVLEGEAFRWIRGAPEHHGLPDRTRFVVPRRVPCDG